MKYEIRLWLTIVLIIQATFVQGQLNSFDIREGRDRLTATFESYDNIVVINMMLEDSIPVRMILDSGIEGVIITDYELVKYFESNCLRSFKLTAPGTSASMDACVTSLIKMNYSRLQPLYSNLILLQEDKFSLETFIGAKVHGLIGIDKFRNMVVSLDYHRETIRFDRPDSYKTPRRSEVIPIAIYRGRPYITARVELDTGEIRTLWLMIDSGANHPLLIEMDSTDNYQPVKSLETVIGRGLGGNIEGAFVRSDWLMLGSFRLNNIITSVTSEYFAGSSVVRNFRNGTLGSGALSRFIVAFDYSGNRLILRKGAKYDDPFEYNMSGVVFESINAVLNIFKVSEIIPGSPGERAGVLPDDLLISINNHSAFTLDLGELNDILSKRPGNSIIITVSRNGKPMTFRFKLERLI